MNTTTKIVKTILGKPGPTTPEDILYCLHLKNEHPITIAKALNKSRELVIHVIYGRHKSYDVASKICEVLQTSLTTLWGDSYNYTPRKNQRDHASNQPTELRKAG